MKHCVRRIVEHNRKMLFFVALLYSNITNIEEEDAK